MVPVKLLVLEHHVGNGGKDNERDTLLYHLQLNQGKRSSVAHEPQSVGRHLTAILKESDDPREGDNRNEGPIGRDTRLLQLQVTIPCKGHKNVARNEQQDGVESINHIIGVEKLY